MTWVFPNPFVMEVNDFLTNCSQTVRLGLHTQHGRPTGICAEPLLFALYTHDCVPTHPTNTIIKFTDGTTVVGLISGEDKTAYRDGVQRLAMWYSDNILILNSLKTKELIIKF